MNRFCFILLLLTTSLGATAVAEVSRADQLWDKAQATLKVTRPRPQVIDESPVWVPEFFQSYAAWNQTIGNALLAFIEQQPTDPRRWEAIVALARNGRVVIKEIGDGGSQGWAGVVHDDASETAWIVRTSKLLEELLATPGVPEKLLKDGYNQWVECARMEIRRGGSLAEIRRRIDVMRERFPEHEMLLLREVQYLNGLRRADPAAVDPWLHQVAAWPNATFSNWAKGELAVEELRRTPIELKFTAIDGREVDLAQLRGKVVLIDFWATWCGPCVAEIPNVKAVYDRYHDQGFEVIGVSLDKKSDRQKLVDFVQKRQLPWPQHYDLDEQGRNVLAAKYSITAIPAMFLFGPDGKLVMTNARGEKLEAVVKRLLGL